LRGWLLLVDLWGAHDDDVFVYVNDDRGDAP
jgi:hypothetical protein